jgi:hypothetical protein
MISTISPSLLALETFQNHFIFILKFKIFFLNIYIYIFANNKKKKKNAWTYNQVILRIPSSVKEINRNQINVYVNKWFIP